MDKCWHGRSATCDAQSPPATHCSRELGVNWCVGCLCAGGAAPEASLFVQIRPVREGWNNLAVFVPFHFLTVILHKSAGVFTADRSFVKLACKSR